MENIKWLNENEIKNFDDYLLKIHNNFNSNLNNHNCNDDSCENEDDDFIIIDAIENIKLNKYSEESISFLISLLNNYNINEFLKQLFTRINEIELLDTIVTKILNIFEEKIFSLELYKILNVSNINVVQSIKFFEIFEKYYEYGYKYLNENLWNAIINKISQDQLKKSFINCCSDGNVLYLNYLIDNKKLDSSQQDYLNIIKINEHFTVIKTILEKVPNLIISNDMLTSLILRFLHDKEKINYYKQYSKKHNIDIDYAEINNILLSGEVLSTVIELTKNGQDYLLSHYIDSINNKVLLSEEYFELIRELALNNKYETIGTIYKIFKNNQNYNKLEKQMELWEDIKSDFEINGKTEDLSKIYEIIMK